MTMDFEIKAEGRCRSKNFTEREKGLLIEIAKDFGHIINNKKTDTATVGAKKKAWRELTTRFNAESETGLRTEKQLYALYDNLKKKAKKDKQSEASKTEGVTICPKTSEVDEESVASSTHHFDPLTNDNESNPSVTYYNLEIKTEVLDEEEDAFKDEEEAYKQEISEDSSSSTKDFNQSTSLTPKIKNISESQCASCKKNKFTSFVKRIKEKQHNEDMISAKKLEILQVQREQEFLKLQKQKVLFDLDIELKKVMLENAKLDLELKRRKLD